MLYNDINNIHVLNYNKFSESRVVNALSYQPTNLRHWILSAVFVHTQICGTGAQVTVIVARILVILGLKGLRIVIVVVMLLWFLKVIRTPQQPTFIELLTSVKL